MSPLLKSLSPLVKNFVGSLLPQLDTAVLMKVWAKLEPMPGGRLIFSEILGKVVPYTGTISPTIMELSPGNALVVMTDRSSVRNHLRSVHAMALANLGECASGLALLSQLPESHRGILVGFRTEYVKKARGTLTSRGSLEDWKEISGSEERVAVALAEIRNSQHEIVARCFSEWKVSPKVMDSSSVNSQTGGPVKPQGKKATSRTGTQSGSKPKKGRK